MKFKPGDPVIVAGEGMWKGLTGTVDSYDFVNYTSPGHRGRAVLYLLIDDESRSTWGFRSTTKIKAVYEDTLELDMSKVPIEVSPETYEID